MRTCTLMIYTNGHYSRYAVMVGPMLRNTFLSGRARTVAVYHLTNQQPDYRAMTAAHATAKAPAVYWQA